MQIISNDIQLSPGHEITLVTGFSARQRDGSPKVSSLAMWIRWGLSYVLTVLQSGVRVLDIPRCIIIVVFVLLPFSLL
jgi:hypothetical protein